MPYTVASSEQTRSSCAEYETKALLYLMNLRNDSDQIYYFVVDFFNDLTGMDRFAEDMWDVQSKGAKRNSPDAVGRGLVTLFNNYLSEFEFKYYILFLGGVSSTVRKDESLDKFGILNIKDSALMKIKKGLKDEATQKKYIINSVDTDSDIDKFLDKVLFVIDYKSPTEYVKAIIKNHPRIICDENILNAIFNEIKNAQSALKNTMVNSVTIQAPNEVIQYCRHMTNSEIRLMTLSRIINRNPVEKNSIPPSFQTIYTQWPPEKQRGMLDECVQALCRALFNKNAASSFWSLFGNIYSLIVTNPTYTVEEIYQSLDSDARNASPDFDLISLKYFISVVKDGIQNDN